MGIASGTWLPEVKAKCEFEVDPEPDAYWTFKLSRDQSYKVCQVLVSLASWPSKCSDFQVSSHTLRLYLSAKRHEIVDTRGHNVCNKILCLSLLYLCFFFFLLQST